MKRERGGVLILVLIVLVVQLIGMAALLRSTSTATAVVGNTASKQAAIAAADTAIQAAAAMLAAQTDPDTSVAGSYFATQQGVDGNGLLLASWTGVTARQVGNFQVQYLIDRLCDAPLPVTAVQCTVPATQETTATSHQVGGGAAQLLSPGSLIPVYFYRVTARVVGPKSSESFVQAVLSK